uniref:NADH-ubiquinone oxidoreductase chain 3 n=1 Tax=Sphaeridium bipustulatum TaxID=290649 RepID=A0A0S2M8C5_9COLE|nr:NADH dehydrogenase subunit 3 [Sphaeridium bipustulatum]ALO70942.1 NADH deshydrogenase subunit 3 [Sphaeridium bipustulatum]
MVMLYMATIIFCITMIVMLLASTLSKKTHSDREKNSPFECGFDPKSNSRMPFSLQFFLIAVIFLIFDVEITLLVPFILILPIVNIYNYIFTLFLFLIILLLGTYHEWNQGALNWAY